MKAKSDRQRADAPGLISVPNRMSASPIPSGPDLERLLGTQTMSSLIVRPKGFVLFAEGQETLGVYVLRDGRVKLSIGSDNGKSLILGLVGRGTVLGLPGQSWLRPMPLQRRW